MKNYLQKLFINCLAGGLFNTVTEDNLIQIKGRDNKGRLMVFYRKKRLDEEKIKRLIASAELFAKSDIWRLLKRAVQLSANERMYKKSRNADDMLAGKMALYNLEVIDRTIQNISQLRL